MKRFFFGWLLLLALLPLASAAPIAVGVVVIHGKQGAPDRDVALLARAMERRGWAVQVPVMPWAGDRIYSASYGQALRQLDGVAAALRAGGAEQVFMAGHSLGANAALGYAAGNPGLAGLVLLAPGHFPEDRLYQRRVAPYRNRALRLVAAGRGDVVVSFQDPIQSFMIKVRATPAVFLSYTNPDGPAVMARNAAAIPRSIPILLIRENNPAVEARDQMIFRAAPANPLSRYLRSPAEHVRVPDQSIDQVIDWIADVAKRAESAPPRSLRERR